MSLGVNLLMYLTEIASKSLGKSFMSKIYEVHHKHKKDYPSGTALMLGRGVAKGKNKDFYSLIGKKYLNKKSFPYGKKINFNSIRKGQVIGEHEVTFSSGKDTAITQYNNEAKGIEFAVNDSLTVSFNEETAEKETTAAIVAGATTKVKTTVESEMDTLQVAYVIGGATVGIHQLETKNADYTAGKDEKVTIFSLAMEF